MKGKRAWLAIALVLVLALAGWRMTTARRAQQADVPPAPTQVLVELAPGDVVRAEVRELRHGLPVSGSLKAVHSAFVKARVAGELQGLALREGDAVQAGQVVARVEPTEAQARLQQAQQQAGAAQAQIAIAERQYRNNQKLVDQGFISKSALDTSLDNLAAAQANHRAGLAAVALARKALQDTVLRAPIAGVVAQRLAQPGERVPVDGRVIEIVDLTRLELEATLSAADSLQLRIGQRAQLHIEGGAQPVAATVVRINPSAQAGSRSVLAYLLLADPTGLRQGLFAQGTVAVDSASALAVPLAAVRTDKPTPYVQLVQDGRIAHQAVQPGPRGTVEKEEWVAVQGVPAGALVVRGHVGALREGVGVKFTQMGGAPALQPSPGGRGSKSSSPGL